MNTKHTLLRLTLLAFLTVFAADSAFGQANQFPPGKMTFQGFLTDAASPPVPLGNASPENKSVIFKIYKNPTSTASGDVLWAETQVVTVDKGHFSVLLGEGSSVSGLPHNTDLSGVFIGSDASDRWIGITVDGAEITPRIQFFAAPYAQLARAANSLVSSSGTNLVTIAGGNVGIGTTSPGTPLDVRGSVTFGTPGQQVAFEANAGFTRTAFNELRFWDWDGGSDMVTFSAGKVGIGTTSPENTLDVVGGVLVRGGYGTASTFNTLTLGGADNTPNAGSAAWGNNGGWKLNFGTPVNSVFTPRVTFVDTGNVGIGTTSPATKLHVEGNVFVAGGYGTSVAGSVNTLTIGGGGASPNSGSFAWGHNGGWKLNFGTPINGTFTPRVTFVDDGSVGIGTTTPTQAKLVVNGSGGADTVGNHFNLLSHTTEGPHIGSFSLNDVSIKGTHAIHAAHFRAVSDARIKNVQGRSDGNADLEILKEIEVVDYLYKDVVSRGDRPQKKVIGQQVDQVFPQAVVKSVDVVPDIYQKAKATDGWVNLATNLKKGERVRLMSKTGEGIYEVLEVTPESFRTEFDPKADEVFVYGREVNDFRVVDYEAISMLNVSATQELARRTEALEKSEARIAELEKSAAKVAELESKAARVESLEREVAELKKLVASLAQGQATARRVALNSTTTASE